MRFGAYLAVLISALTATAAISLASPGTSGAQDTEITTADFYFCDASFENGVCDTSITAGDTVTWSVTGGFHTVTECDSSFAACPPSGGFDSSQLVAGGQFQQTFATPGTFYYRCDNHPTQMRGTITVTGAQETPTPEPTDSPTADGSATATPAVSVTATPAGAPSTGGEPGSPGSAIAITLLGAALAASAAMVVLLSSRRIRG